MNNSENNHPLRRTRAEVDLDLLSKNIRTLWNRSGCEGYLLLLKANAYGHGSIACAKMAEELGVTFGGVAAYQEVRFLRSAGVRLPLLLLEDLFDDEITPAFDAGVSFSVSSLAYAEKVARVAEKAGKVGKVHLNVDTGMGRLGCFPDELMKVAEYVHHSRWLALEGLFSHFPSSDEGDLTVPTAQIELFSRLDRELEAAGIRPKWRHFANSGAVIDFPAASSFDMIRPGVSSFGIYPSKEVAHDVGLFRVLSLKSAILSIRSFPKGAKIGYGSTFVTERESRIAVVPIGYGDGYVRAFSNNSDVLVHGRRVPVVGRISMDMITVDLTELPESVATGDEAVLVGSQTWEDRSGEIDAEDLAARIGTISYEVTCLLTARVPRVFFRGGKAVAVQEMSEHFYREY